MFSQKPTPIKEHGSFGQSLVETALFLPLIIFLLAGVLELSNLLLTQNRVSAAARSGTRFAAANFGADQWAAWDVYAAEVANVVLNNVTETLDLDPTRWDIWVIKATVGAGKPEKDPEVDWFLEWEAVHVDDGDPAGVDPVMSEDEWLARQSSIKEEVRSALDTVPVGTRIVATDAYHNRHAFLGLVPYNLGAFTRIRGFTVMRVDETGGTYGSCDTFPIALSLNNRAVFPSNYQPANADELAKFTSGEYEWYPFHNYSVDPGGTQLHPKYQEIYGNNPWPYGGGYHWAADPNKPQNRNANDVPPPFYTVSDRSAFPFNQPGRHIKEAQRGDIFVVKQATTNIPSAFGWLRWNSNTSGGSASDLRTSLTWPGNSGEYCYNEASCPTSPSNEPSWSADGQINVYDRLKVATGSMSSGDAQMVEHVDEGVYGRLLRLIVFTPPDYVENGNPPGDANGDSWGTVLTGGSDTTYEVYAFVLGRVVGYKLSGQGNWLLLEFHGWDVDCAPAPPAYP